MRPKLKPLAEQVMVITGGNSGIGLAVARKAASAGAAVVLAARDEASLRRACDEINAAGGRAHPVIGDAASGEEAERVARAATARFGRFDSWVDASGDPRTLVHAAEAAVRHVQSRKGVGALVGFGSVIAEAARAELKRGGHAISATMIKLPADWRPDKVAEGVVDAALFAAARPMGHMAVAPGGRRLTLLTEAQKHRGLVLGVGLLALAATAAWLGRERIATAAKPQIRRAVAPLILAAAKRRPVQAVELMVRHPRQALKLARALR